MLSFSRRLSRVAGALCVGVLARAGEAPASLPDPFRFRDGSRVTSRADWERRRTELRADLLDFEYGHAPPLPVVGVRDEQREELRLEPDGLHATRVTVTLTFGNTTARAGYWFPSEAAGPRPTILADEPVWWPNPFLTNHVVNRVLARGYVLAGFWNDDFASFEKPEHHPAQTAFPGYDWGVTAVAAWAYGVTMNWLETLPVVDARKVAIWGHSRRGKACLLAGALDDRFAAVLPHMSGMGGAAAYRVRGRGAQELEQLLERFWLRPRMFAFIDQEESLPFDQHWLHALVAPRALCSHVGIADAWGNPAGEQASWRAAREVYAWLDASEQLGIHFADYGHHDPNGPEGGDSWETALEFLAWRFEGKPPRKAFARPLFPDAPGPFTWRAPATR